MHGESSLHHRLKRLPSHPPAAMAQSTDRTLALAVLLGCGGWLAHSAHEAWRTGLADTRSGTGSSTALRKSGGPAVGAGSFLALAGGYLAVMALIVAPVPVHSPGGGPSSGALADWKFIVVAKHSTDELQEHFVGAMIPESGEAVVFTTEDAPPHEFVHRTIALCAGPLAAGVRRLPLDDGSRAEPPLAVGLPPLDPQGRCTSPCLFGGRRRRSPWT